ncbi:T6SS effector amidase Tae4 family protein [Prosthecomicrobium sp. N25]|uniref:T6SS effector amidase Tae4 family protein n=1 Tax=Prosthecomicrobium sp. N25 TaxID=3129254 RepID=UPI003077F0F6
MEAFFDPATGRPVETLDIKQGETRILGVKKFTIGEVAYRTDDFKTAFVDLVIHLRKPKVKYDDHYNLHEVASDSVPVEQKGHYFFQICGNNPGTTQFVANRIAGNTPYARPVSIRVAADPKLLVFHPSMPFDVLWANHPLNPANRTLYPRKKPDEFDDYDPSHPCQEAKWLAGQCMVRFCVMLEKSGITFDGLHGGKCGIGGKQHFHHFVNPYDFESWKGLKRAYVFEAKPPYRPEPMPGIAAYYFCWQRRGVILFWNYFPTGKEKKDMFGGHIDLWNRDRMGNTYAMPDPNAGLAAFARARKIVFWPLESV